MEKNIFRKEMVFAVIVLFIGAGALPGISGYPFDFRNEYDKSQSGIDTDESNINMLNYNRYFDDNTVLKCNYSDNKNQKENIEILPIYYNETIAISENGEANIELSIDVPSSRYSNIYREMLGEPTNVAMDEWVSIPEKKVIKNENKSSITLGREEFFKSISIEQWFSLGLNVRFTDSQMLFRGENNGCEIFLQGCSFVESIHKVDGEKEFTIGPSAGRDIEQAIQYIGMLVGYTRLLLESIPDKQIFERYWKTSIILPDKTFLVNEERLEELQWTLNFGDGSYLDAAVLVVNPGIIVVEEKLVVSEYGMIVPIPTLNGYKSLKLKYVSPNYETPSDKSMYLGTSDILNASQSSDPSYSFDDTWNFEGNTTIYDINEDYEITCYLGIQASFQVHINSNEAWIKPSFNVEINFTADFYQYTSYDSGYTQIIDPLQWLTYFIIGPIPVVVTVDAGPEYRVIFNATAGTTINARTWTNASFKAGASYSIFSGFNLIWEKEFNFDHDEFILTGGEADIKPSISFPIKAKFYSVLGPEIRPEIYLLGTIRQENNENFWWLKLGLDVLVGICLEIDFFGIKLYEKNWEKPIYDLTIKEWSNEPQETDIIYVDDDYNPNTQGWEITHFNNIQDGINTVNEHGTVHVFSGSYNENVIIGKSINLIGNDINNTIIYSSENNNAVTIYASFVNISGFTIHGNDDLYAGVIVGGGFANSSNISGNIIKNTNRGIYLTAHSFNNHIFGNIITNNKDAIYLSTSNNNFISGNTITNNSGYGIHLQFYSKFNDIVNNTFLNTGDDCIRIEFWSNDNNILSNIITNNSGSGIALRIKSNNCTVYNNTINNSFGGIYLWNINGTIIFDNEIHKNIYGIVLNGMSFDNIIYSNFISNDTQRGLHMYNAFNSFFVENTFAYDSFELWNTSINNIFYHNNFLNIQNSYFNGDNIWDNGYPCGGNYWNDYSGMDNFSGVNQNISGSDGIGDIPYVFYSNQDNYPLIQPWNGTLSVLPPDTVYVDDNYNFSTPGWQIDHFDNIQDGIDAVAKEGTVHVSNGAYYENIFMDKTLNLVGEDKNNTIINGNGSGSVIRISVDQVTITEFTIQNSSNGGWVLDCGIYLNSKNCSIKDNIFVNNEDGITLYDAVNNIICANKIVNNSSNGITIHSDSNNNHIYGNVIKNNENDGIYIHDSLSTSIEENTIQNNGGYGINLNWKTDNSTLRNNNITLNSRHGIFLSSSNSTISANTITYNNYSGIYLFPISSNNSIIRGNNITHQSYGIRMTSSFEITIRENTISNNDNGIYMGWECHNNTIFENNITKNRNGTYMQYQNNHNNTIYRNNIVNNTNLGIHIDSSSDNIIYNNIFSNNTQNAYDGGINTWNITKMLGTNIIGGPYIGGNYWGDHSCVDNGGDGFCDNPYIIPGGGNTDWLPLSTNSYAKVIMEDVCIPIGIGTGSGYLKVENVTEYVGSCQIELSWDPTVFSVIDVHGCDFDSLYYYLDNLLGKLSIIALNIGVGLTGDFCVAEITFEALTCPLCNSIMEIVDSILLTDDPIPDEISHTRINGAICCCCHCVDGDMNGDGTLNSADVRYLALYICGDPDYSMLCADGNVNSDGAVNGGDVRYLALYICGDPDYTPLYPDYTPYP